MIAARFSGLAARAARSFAKAPRPAVAGVELNAMAPSLWPADAGFLAEWADGRLGLGGVSVPLEGRSPLDIRDAPTAWHEALYGFGWLRHVPAAARGDAALRVDAVLVGWLRDGASRSRHADADPVKARRALSWLAHADVLLQTDNGAHYDRVLTALSAEIQGLERRWRQMDQAGARILALMAIAEGSLCIAGLAPLQEEAETGLAHELSQRRAPALVGLLRKPDVLAGLILDMEALRLLYKMRLLPVPGFLLEALARFTGTLAGLQHGDGSLARLGSARLDAESRLTLAAVRRHVGLPAALQCHDQAAGYARLALGDACVIIDAGAPLGNVHALALEMSSGAAPMLVHDGVEGAPQRGHATLVLTPDAARPDTCATLPEYWPNLEAAHNIDVALADPAIQSVDATHAGPARNGFVHRRRVTLEQNGRLLSGIDDLRPLVSQAAPANSGFAARFVLHPGVVVGVPDAQDRVDLTLPNGHRWTLSAAGQTLSVEGALYRDGPRTVPTLQILVLSGDEPSRSVTWQLQRDDGDTSTS